MEKWEEEIDDVSKFGSRYNNIMGTDVAEIVLTIKDIVRPLIPRWVKVEDGLPKIEGWYQTRSMLFKGETSGYYGRSYCKQGMPMKFPKYVTHWLNVKIPAILEEGK